MVDAMIDQKSKVELQTSECERRSSGWKSEAKMKWSWISDMKQIQIWIQIIRRIQEWKKQK